jgi:hypothetical protein
VSRVVEPRHPTLRQLHGYWLKKKAGRFAPARRDIDPAELRDLLPCLFLVDVEGRPIRFRFRLVGTEIVESFGIDVTGRYVEEIGFSDRAPSVLAYYAAVVTTREPSCHIVRFTRGGGRHLTYERVILPLSSDGETVDMLLGGICFEEAYETSWPSAARRAGA